MQYLVSKSCVEYIVIFFEFNLLMHLIVIVAVFLQKLTNVFDPHLPI